MSDSSYDSDDDSDFVDDVDLDLSILVTKNENGSLTIKLSVEHTILTEEERDAILSKICGRTCFYKLK